MCFKHNQLLGQWGLQLQEPFLFFNKNQILIDYKKKIALFVVQSQNQFLIKFEEMGCATSKPRVCHNCHTPYSHVRRSHSSKFHRGKHENEHLVNLTSSTLGSLKQLDSMNWNRSLKDDHFTLELDDNKDALLIEAKTWSQMLNEKISKVVTPKTPVRTPPGEPETINAWELMEDLDDHDHSFLPKMDDQECSLHSNDTSIVSDFDAEVISTFRKAYEELPPANPFHLKPLNIEKMEGKEKEDAFNGVERLVVYFTSLRGVRKTYEDCCHVRVILKGLGVKVDERDTSMHSGFKEELKELLAEEYPGGGLPKVFLGKKFIGGADEIRRMNEDGKLEKLVEKCEKIEDGEKCEGCGDVRFVPCETCSGSCKIYCDAEYDEHDECGFQRCPDCNENGLIRCPICCT